MAQYIDKAAVVAEIEKLKGQLLRGACSSQISMETSCKEEAYDEVLSFLDTHTLEVKEVEEEPINKDLEEAARKVGQKYFPDENNIWARHNYEAKAAANAFKEGAKWQEEQIMNSAIERTVKVDAGGYPFIEATELYDYDNDKPLAKAGDKIKVVFIKDK